jgi:hypothetical protein
MPSRNSRRRAANRVDHHGRLRYLKGVSIGLSAIFSMGFWWLVSGAVAAQNAPAASNNAITQPAFANNGSFFGGASGPSLSGGITAQRPRLRTGGS